MLATNSAINITEDDETFLKNFLRDFYHKIIDADVLNTFEDTLIKWVKNALKNHDKYPEALFKMMENHENCQTWFAGFMGFLYQHGIGCDINRNSALELYFFGLPPKLPHSLNCFELTFIPPSISCFRFATI